MEFKPTVSWRFRDAEVLAEKGSLSRIRYEHGGWYFIEWVNTSELH